ncbi:triose-phosphate isomerase [Pyramidobacter sp. SM-530-WT-4B]|uniref:Triosephosphate isomerase n=1 Tax=Pyramidobacter porci TaxID=2605789 RepID=A0A6L5YAV6_9BACT|nr:triose-phosphate isomerase [Pyramidobacter porci]MST54672.1 triose-phosphate isomerase [Pyramidobacter porci]
MKKIFLFGNWKMNQSLRATENFAAESAAFFSERPGLKAETEICIFPPFVLIPEAVKNFTNLGVTVGAQNASDHGEGAYTGEVAPSMLKEAGCRYVIVGHSERRHIYGESSELVNKKALNCLTSGLIPVLCVGETLEERDAGRTTDVISDQLRKGVKDFPAGAAYVVAYEPVWAIGTGRAASAEDAEKVCRLIKDSVRVPVLYGGSVKPSNAAELFSRPSIDGGLIGGASLKARDFFAILKNFRAAELEAVL